MDLGEKHGFGNVWGHKLTKVLAIRAENEKNHTNSVPLRRIWPPKNLGDGKSSRSTEKKMKVGFWENKNVLLWNKKKAGSIGRGPFGSHLGSLLFGAHLGPVWGPFYLVWGPFWGPF